MRLVVDSAHFTCPVVCPPAGKRLERCELGLPTAAVDSEGGTEAGTYLPATSTAATGKHCYRDSGVFFFCILVTSRQLHRHHRSRVSCGKGGSLNFSVQWHASWGPRGTGSSSHGKILAAGLQPRNCALSGSSYSCCLPIPHLTVFGRGSSLPGGVWWHYPSALPVISLPPNFLVSTFQLHKIIRWDLFPAV